MVILDQIVGTFDQVSRHPELSTHLEIIKMPIARVLIHSQLYMRQREVHTCVLRGGCYMQCIIITQDECSFVSLRDVKRTMIVFEYMYSKMSILVPRMDKRVNISADQENAVEFLVVEDSLCDVISILGISTSQSYCQSHDISG